MSKTAKVRAALLSGEVLTVRGISRRWDINCPYAVIRDIRNGGIDVLDRQQKTVDGVRFKQYYVVA